MHIRSTSVLILLLVLGGCTNKPAPSASPPADTPPPAEEAIALEPEAMPESEAPSAASDEPPASPEAAEPPSEPEHDASKLSVDSLVGDYATESYAQRAEGYDWVGVSIEKIHGQEAYIKVRGRGDKKRGTCTFDGVGRLVEENVLETTFDGKAILFRVNDGVLTVSTRSPEDEGLLNYFCGGGASLADTYTKLEEPLDPSQLAEEAFSTELSLQGVTFAISANDVLPQATLVIRPQGLEEDNRLIVQPVDGLVTGAEIEDLNSDGWPEVVVYTQSVGSGSYGSVIAYSVNNGKSVSAIAFPELTGEAAIGYMGHDEFALVETTLARRFPVYKEGDSNAEPTGGTRQISYELVDGEAMRQFQIKDVMDFPAE